MTQYRVTWEIDVDADSVVEAARMAQEAQRDPQSTANAFDVRNEETGKIYAVDLDEEDKIRRAELEDPSETAGDIAFHEDREMGF